MGQEIDIRSEALRSLYDAYFRHNPDRVASLENEFLNAQIAQRLYDRRQQLGLTQEELAVRVGVDAEVISDIEEADFQGDATEILANILTVLGKPTEEPPSHTLGADAMD